MENEKLKNFSPENFLRVFCEIAYPDAQVVKIEKVQKKKEGAA